ncbi:hypothetical protein RJ639_038213 [Escallonia herrerae]|uniref:Retrotransposon Copia-like N-terminal domain-containing protein n=1 Tax=Escallonia herrerae TaxID=1293975 RepID=A0AA89B5V1_9ASTE|nr:hypothetical protein RJ639_038213 [Escallonia herrerae]
MDPAQPISIILHGSNYILWAQAMRSFIKDLAHQYQLHDSLHRMKQEPGQSINSFLSQMQGIWDQLKLSEPSWTCSEDLAHFIVYRDHLRLIQFLMSLTDAYESVQSSLLHQSPLPTLDNVVAELRYEETRRGLLQTRRPDTGPFGVTRDLRRNILRSWPPELPSGVIGRHLTLDSITNLPPVAEHGPHRHSVQRPAARVDTPTIVAAALQRNPEHTVSHFSGQVGGGNPKLQQQQRPGALGAVLEAETHSAFAVPKKGASDCTSRWREALLVLLEEEEEEESEFEEESDKDEGEVDWKPPQQAGTMHSMSERNEEVRRTWLPQSTEVAVLIRCSTCPLWLPKSTMVLMLYTMMPPLST